MHEIRSQDARNWTFRKERTVALTSEKKYRCDHGPHMYLILECSVRSVTTRKHTLKKKQKTDLSSSCRKKPLSHNFHTGLSGSSEATQHHHTVKGIEDPDENDFLVSTSVIHLWRNAECSECAAPENRMSQPRDMSSTRKMVKLPCDRNETCDTFAHLSENRCSVGRAARKRPAPTASSGRDTVQNNPLPTPVAYRPERPRNCHISDPSLRMFEELVSFSLTDPPRGSSAWRELPPGKRDVDIPSATVRAWWPPVPRPQCCMLGLGCGCVCPPPTQSIPDCPSGSSNDFRRGAADIL